MRILLPFFLLLVCLSSCLDDEDYTTSTSDVLRFSVDSVAFDTIISGEPTNTYTFTVYNPASKAIRIPRVYLECGDSSCFSVNVDGTTLVSGEGEDFEIASKDSMLVFLNANVPETDVDDPVFVEDNLVFVTEAGVEQKVNLSASGQTVIDLTSYHVTGSEMLSANRPYRVMDSLVVDVGAILYVMPGTRVYFHSEAELIVHGSVQILGTLASPVTFRGDRMGYMFDGQPYDRIPGQWGGVVLSSESYDNYISYADIHSGNFGIRVDSSDVSLSKLVMENSIVHNTIGDGISSRMSQIYVGNSQITNSGGTCVKIRGGYVTFIHCTIARFYVFTGGDGYALEFSNYDDNVRLPLTLAQFANCIITGYQDDEVMGTINDAYPDDAYDYAFFNCLFNTTHPDEEDSRLVNCLWDDAEGDDAVSRDGNFYPEFDIDALSFSFELNPKSQAIGAADASISELYYPQDRLGRTRVSDDIAPDIGCLQHQTTEE